MNCPRYAITDAAALKAVGLPKFMLGTWDHYNTTLGMVRLGRISGKGCHLASISVDDFAKGVELGLFVKVA